MRLLKPAPVRLLNNSLRWIFLLATLFMLIPLFAADIPPDLPSPEGIVSLRQDLIRIASELFPEQAILPDTVRIRTFHDVPPFTEPPEIKQIAARLREMEARYTSLRFGNIPYLNLSLAQNEYQAYERFAEIYSHVPVAWDNENPEQIDINLPNGGHGLVWVPKPIEYEWKFIETHASREYHSRYSTASMGLYYQFPFGATLHLMNLSLGYKHEPKNYGFPWYTTLTNSFSVPLVDLFDPASSSQTMQEENLRNQISLQRDLLDQTRTNLGRERLLQLLQLYAQWRQLLLNQSMIELTAIQLEDIDQLYQRQMVSTFDRLNLQRQYQEQLAGREQLLYSLILSSAGLQQTGNSFVLYFPEVPDPDSLIATFEDKLPSDPADFERIHDLSAVKSAENGISVAKNDLLLMERKSRPDVNLDLSMDMFESNDLGYSDAWKAFQNVSANPDGINWTATLSWRVPMTWFSENRERNAAKENVQAQQAYRSQLEQSLVEEARNYRVAVIQSKAGVASAMETLRYNRERLEGGKALLAGKRISRLEYVSYLKEYHNAEFGLLQARIQYIAAILRLLRFLEIP